MKVIVSFSGGKDSLASLLWVRNNLTKDFITVFCDTGWEHPLTYKYIEEVQEQLGLNLITVKSKKFNGMVDLTKKKSRWPSSQRRFCTSELKTIPMIDYILDEVNDDVLIIQGIRAAESAKRAEMSKQCTYFKYYVQPYGKDKNGKDKYHTYRRKDVLAFRKKYADDLLRPVFDWSAQQVIDYILENGIQPNPLYRMGYKRWELQTKPPTLRGKFWTPQRIAKLAFPFHKHPDGSPMAGEEVFDRLWGEDVPAWSLCRLLELLPTEIRIGTSENVFGLHHETSDAWLLSYPYVKSFETASPVESCVLAIDWLIANGHFNKEYYNEENNVQ